MKKLIGQFISSDLATEISVFPHIEETMAFEEVRIGNWGLLRVTDELPESLKPDVTLAKARLEPGLQQGHYKGHYDILPAHLDAWGRRGLMTATVKTPIRLTVEQDVHFTTVDFNIETSNTRSRDFAYSLGAILKKTDNGRNLLQLDARAV